MSCSVAVLLLIICIQRVTGILPGLKIAAYSIRYSIIYSIRFCMTQGFQLIGRHSKTLMLCYVVICNVRRAAAACPYSGDLLPAVPNIEQLRHRKFPRYLRTIIICSYSMFPTDFSTLVSCMRSKLSSSSTPSTASCSCRSCS